VQAHSLSFVRLTSQNLFVPSMTWLHFPGLLQSGSSVSCRAHHTLSCVEHTAVATLLGWPASCSLGQWLYSASRVLQLRAAHGANTCCCFGALLKVMFLGKITLAVLFETLSPWQPAWQCTAVYTGGSVKAGL
jgi:hypothetical protein